MAKKSIRTATAPPSAPVTGPIALDPIDWYIATWRNLPTLPRGEPAPFDQKEALARLSKIQPEWTHQGWNWDKGNIALVLSREEAHFWLVAMLDTKVEGSIDLAARMSKQKFDGKLTRKQIAALLKCEPRYSERIVIPLANLVSPAELAGLLVDGSGGKHGPFWVANWSDVALAREFARSVLPYLSVADRAAIRPVVAPYTDQANWTAREFGDKIYRSPLIGTYLAALVGLHDEILALVSSWPEDPSQLLFVDYGMWAMKVVFGLGDPRLVQQHVRRLKLVPADPLLLRGWLAHTELSGLDVFRDMILQVTNKKGAEKEVEFFGQLVIAPEAAPVMLDLQLNSKASAAARKWLDDHIDLAIAGLTPIATGQGKLAEAAARFLHDARLKGHGGDIASSQPAPPPPPSNTPAPAWLASALNIVSKGKSPLPDWADPVVFPPIRAGDYTLDHDQVRALLVALQKSDLGTPQPLVTAVKAHADARGLDAFAWRLFELWRSAGFPSKEKWAFHALGHLGSDTSVLKLVPLIRAWPGESQHARAVVGLEVLRAVGSDLALMQLNGIAQKLKFQALKAKAQQFMEEIAQARGLTREQLEDRVVPTLDLANIEATLFDFGPRIFHLVLGDDLQPMVRDAVGGAIKPDLPKPAKSDDEAKATEAVARWKQLKKQVKEVVRIQTARLELAMVVGRRWTVPEFETLLVRHPLMIHLISRLLWGGYDNAGKLTETFRVTQDRLYLYQLAKPCKLEAFASVGIAHPLHLDERDRSQWKSLFGPSGQKPLFPQLDRPVCRLLPEEEGITILTRFKTASVPAGTLKNGLEQAGWVRGPIDQGAVEGHSLYFPAADVTAGVHYHPPLYMGGYGFAEGQTHSIEQLFFTRGKTIYREGRLPLMRLGEVDPVVLSEVLHLLTTMTTPDK